MMPRRRDSYSHYGSRGVGHLLRLRWRYSAPIAASFGCESRDHGFSPRRVNSIGKEAILRARQAEMFAQRRPFVVAPKQATVLQLWDDVLDEIVKPARQVGKHHS